MKDLLYYTDAYIQSFDASVVKTATAEDGRHYVVLNNTAFYPTGGGQPHDIGTLNDVAVTDVEKIADEIRHYVVAPLEGAVHGQLNWTRRFDFMQQHAGQHILTAAFVELFDYATVSFHLGSDTVTIDITTDNITEEQLAQAEARANAIIIENRSITTTWITRDELANYPLRKDIAVEGENIRLVIIPDYDYNGCGGTHPSSTGQVQALKILAVEKLKQQSRIHFVCGQRVLQALQMRKTVLSDVARQLSVPEEQAAGALQKVMATAKQTEKKLNEAQDTLLQQQALQLAEQTIVAEVFEDYSMQQLQKVARAISAHNDAAKVFVVSESAGKLQFVAARGKNATQSMKEISAAALPLLNGKGGGNDQLVQGGGEPLLSAHELVEKIIPLLQA